MRATNGSYLGNIDVALARTARYLVHYGHQAAFSSHSLSSSVLYASTISSVVEKGKSPAWVVRDRDHVSNKA